MKNILIIVGLVILLIAGILLFKNVSGSPLNGLIGKQGKVTIQKQTFTVSLAQTDKEKQIGLSGKKSLADNKGMLFPFDKADYYPFWMKDMEFPIDIIYIHNKKIVTIISNAPAPKSKTDTLPVYSPTEPADNVLEVSAGTAAKYHFAVGDTVSISL